MSDGVIVGAGAMCSLEVGTAVGTDNVLPDEAALLLVSNARAPKRERVSNR